MRRRPAAAPPSGASSSLSSAQQRRSLWCNERHCKHGLGRACEAAGMLPDDNFAFAGRSAQRSFWRLAGTHTCGCGASSGQRRSRRGWQLVCQPTRGARAGASRDFSSTKGRRKRRFGVGRCSSRGCPGARRREGRSRRRSISALNLGTGCSCACRAGHSRASCCCDGQHSRGSNGSARPADLACLCCSAHCRWPVWRDRPCPQQCGSCDR
mmetsp:Transcript_23077/g.87281  ORF Transcript_23077/g.87281 Transcript_23077/m.87281 type:complete len:211 (+) Transcript_23077:1194-1826(+)